MLSLVSATLGAATKLVTVASATAAGQVTLVLFGVAAVIFATGYLITAIAGLIKVIHHIKKEHKQ